MRTHLITATEQITSSQRWDAGRDTGICAGVMVAVYIKCCRVAMTIVCRSCGPFHIFLSWCIMMGHWARKQANKGKVGAVLPGASRYLLMRVTSDSSWAPAAGDLEPPSRGTLTPPPADYCCKLCKPTFVKWVPGDLQKAPTRDGLFVWLSLLVKIFVLASQFYV